LAVLAGSLPFFVAGLSQTLYAKVNLTVLGFIAGDTEVGWYGAASSIAGTAMLLAPVIWWVLLPLSARADARSPKELTILTRRAMEMVLVIVTPISLMLGLGADVVVPTLLGPAYAPAVLSLRAMAPVFLLTYLGMVSGGTLIGSGRGWLVTAVLVSGVITSPILNYLFVPRSLAIFGPGGAGVGAAAALNVTEGYITILLTLALGNRAFDRRSLIIFGKTIVVCVGVIAMDRLLLRPYGAVRLAVDVLVYSALVLSWGAADHRALIRLATRALSRPATVHADAA
jgi:O-antigen/teichoic acid export membrane protein